MNKITTYLEALAQSSHEMSTDVRDQLLGLAHEIKKEIADFTEADKFRCDESKRRRAAMEAKGDFDKEEFGFAQELIDQYGGCHIDDDAEVYKIHAKDLYVVMKMLGYGRKQATPEPICYAAINKQGDVTSTHKTRDAWRTVPMYTRAQVLATLQAQPSEVSDEEIRLGLDVFNARISSGGTVIDAVVAAMRTLRPQAVPMTRAQRQQAFNKSWATSTDFFAGIVAAEVHHFGITQRADGGEG